MNTGVFKLDDEYHIDKKGDSFHLVWLSKEIRPTINKRTGKPTQTQSTFTKYYGSLMQAISGYCKCYYQEAGDVNELIERIDELFDRINDAFGKLDELDKKLIREWKIVKYSTN